MSQKRRSLDVLILLRTIGQIVRLGGDFRILADVFRHAVERYDSIVLAVVGIVNRRLNKRLARLAAA